MTRQCFDRATGEWVDPDEYAFRKTSNSQETARGNYPSPHYWSDIPEYKSPLGDWYVSGRTQRKEELRSRGLREVDPSEFKPTYKKESMRKKYSKQKIEE